MIKDRFSHGVALHRGFYMSVNVLLNLLNDLGGCSLAGWGVGVGRCEALPSYRFNNEFNKFDNTGA